MDEMERVLVLKQVRTIITRSARVMLSVQDVELGNA
jgi:hypothetical protein